MNRLNRTDWTPRLPEITEAHRAAGGIDWSVRHVDGSEEIMRIHRPDLIRMVKIYSLHSTTVTALVYTVVGHALRKDLALAFDLHGASVAEVFLIAQRLQGEEAFRIALKAMGIFGQALIRENLPGKPQNLADN
jgi:hypothetical protein